MNSITRITPAILLFFLAPLVAEFLLGDLTIEQLPALSALAPLYGGAAILIRELVRRTGRGWTTFVLLALAYALLEEALLTQSLFNPNYLHLRLIDYGYVPLLGTALPWAIYVIGIHVCWSLAVPIGLVEFAFPERRAVPWLRRPGMLVVASLMGLGAFLIWNFSVSQTPFRASATQVVVSVLLIAISVSIAFLAFPNQKEVQRSRRPVSPVIIGAATLIGGSAFLLANSQGKAHLGWTVTVILQLFVAVTITLFFAWANSGKRWTSVQTWSAALGGMLCYVWMGYSVDRALHGGGHALEHSVFVAVALLAGGWSGTRATRRIDAEASSTD